MYPRITLDAFGCVPVLRWMRPASRGSEHATGPSERRGTERKRLGNEGRGREGEGARRGPTASPTSSRARAPHEEHLALGHGGRGREPAGRTELASLAQCL